MQGGTKAELDLGKLMRKRGVGARHHAARPGRRPGPAARPRSSPPCVHDVWPDVERGVVRPIVDRRLPMSRAAEAHAVVEASEHIGKVLLLPEG